MILHGENIKIYSNGQVIGLATSCTIETTADTSETSSETSARVRNFKAGRTGWQVTLSKLVDNMQADLVMAGNEYVITVYVNGTDMLTGNAICSEVQSEYSVGKLANTSCTFVGNGDLI